jgi:hypothetical protein
MFLDTQKTVCRNTAQEVSIFSWRQNADARPILTAGPPPSVQFSPPTAAPSHHIGYEEGNCDWLKACVATTCLHLTPRFRRVHKILSLSLLCPESSPPSSFFEISKPSLLARLFFPFRTSILDLSSKDLKLYFYRACIGLSINTKYLYTNY